MNNQQLIVFVGSKEANKIQVRATGAVKTAISRGALPNLKSTVVTCTDCASRATMYDHRDYFKLLEVEPVCRGCNRRRGQAFPLVMNKKERVVVVNFGKLVRELIGAGWTQKDIAKKIGCSQPNVARLLKEKNADPRWKIGNKIVLLHKDQCQ